MQFPSLFLAIKTDFNDKNKGLPANGGLFYISRDYLFDRANKLLSSDRLTDNLIELTKSDLLFNFEQRRQNAFCVLPFLNYSLTKTFLS